MGPVPPPCGPATAVQPRHVPRERADRRHLAQGETFLLAVVIIAVFYTSALHVGALLVVGLLVGKPIGVLAATWLPARFTRADLDPDIGWIDVLGLAVLAGIGFTVSLLIGELAFGAGSERDEQVEVAVLVGSLLAAIASGTFLRARSRRYTAVALKEQTDADQDGVPDVDESDQTPAVMSTDSGSGSRRLA